MNPARRHIDDPRCNRLLAVLPDADWLRWRGKLEPYAMPLGQVLYESGVPLTHAYFPTSAIVSLMYVTETGASAAVAVVGDEGMVGVPLIMGARSTPGRAVVHSAGAGFRIPDRQLQEEFARSVTVQRTLLRYTQALIAQMAQIAVCNRHHSVDQQLCRWLLLNLDRMPGSEMVATQELIAHMLGVRREGVTVAARALQDAGLITYRRGRIRALDPVGLGRRSCECRGVIEAEYDRLLRDIAPPQREPGEASDV
jgi:CRP-like cAMP-binding protein